MVHLWVPREVWVLHLAIHYDKHFKELLQTHSLPEWRRLQLARRGDEFRPNGCIMERSKMSCLS